MEKWVRTLAKKILAKERVKGRIDVSFVSIKKIRELNKRFRKKDKPTDVLSFSYGPGEVIGDVIISKNMARQNAKRFKVTLWEEIKRLTIHGVLHILGYTHGRKMRHAEEIYQKF